MDRTGPAGACRSWRNCRAAVAVSRTRSKTCPGTPMSPSRATERTAPITVGPTLSGSSTGDPSITSAPTNPDCGPRPRAPAPRRGSVRSARPVARSPRRGAAGATRSRRDRARHSRRSAGSRPPRSREPRLAASRAARPATVAGHEPGTSSTGGALGRRSGRRNSDRRQPGQLESVSKLTAKRDVDGFAHRQRRHSPSVRDPYPVRPCRARSRIATAGCSARATRWTAPSRSARRSRAGAGRARVAGPLQPPVQSDVRRDPAPLPAAPPGRAVDGAAARDGPPGDGDLLRRRLQQPGHVQPHVPRDRRRVAVDATASGSPATARCCGSPPAGRWPGLRPAG